MQSITQKYLKNEYLPINSDKKYGVCHFELLNSIICNVLVMEVEVSKEIQFCYLLLLD
jgi:hypothetical protein